MTKSTLPAQAQISADLKHGQIKHNILEIALDIVNQAGVHALSMREVARKAGVSHQTPYYYFNDKETIIAELVIKGFRQLELSLRQANQVLEVDKELALKTSARAYIDFALQNPGLFRVMFLSDVYQSRVHESVKLAGKAAFMQLKLIVDDVHGKHNNEAVINLYWSYVHGLANLMLDNALYSNPELTPNEQMQQVIEAFAHLVMSQANH